MGCNCRATKKGIANNKSDRSLALFQYEQYKPLIGDTKIQYFTKEQREKVLEWYYQVYPNSVEVKYTSANKSLIEFYKHHNLL